MSSERKSTDEATTSEERDKELIARAIELAWESRRSGNHPFGALLADDDGKIVMEGLNGCVTEKDITAHAETALIRKASMTLEHSHKVLPTLTLYSSCEPCPMCSGAIFWSGVSRLSFRSFVTVFVTTDGEAETCSID